MRIKQTGRGRKSRFPLFESLLWPGFISMALYLWPVTDGLRPATAAILPAPCTRGRLGSD